jgi:hypothetical protein
VEKYGRDRQAADDNIIRRMLFACWITKATNTLSEYVILIAFPRQGLLCNAPQWYVYTYIARLVEKCLCHKHDGQPAIDLFILNFFSS